MKFLALSSSLTSLGGGDIRYGCVAGSEDGVIGVEGIRGGGGGGSGAGDADCGAGEPLQGVLGAEPGGVTPCSGGGGRTGVVGSCTGGMVGCADCSSIRISPSLL